MIKETVIFLRKIILVWALSTSLIYAGDRENAVKTMDIEILYFCPTCNPVIDPGTFNPIIFKNIQELQTHLKEHQQKRQLPKDTDKQKTK